MVHCFLPGNISVQTFNKTQNMIKEAEKTLASSFEQIEEIAFINQKRVLQAFKNNRLSETHFFEQTGYGLGDYGREIIDNIFAEVMQADRAALRMQFVSGTHAIACALLGNLKTGQRMVSLTGHPYDTLHPVIGLGKESPEANPQSLIANGVLYEKIEFAELLALLNDDQAALDKLASLLKSPTKLVHIQKSRGYSVDRQTLNNNQIAKTCSLVRKINPEVIIMVDNCYGEFVEENEPPSYGADLIAGSLIKNPGGGLAITGGYIAGKNHLVEQSLIRLTAPGINGNLGVLYSQNRLILQGLFTAPAIVANAVKGAVLTASVLQKLDFKVDPQPLSKRSDIVQTIEFGDKDKLLGFCQAVQASSPIDAHVIPEPGDLPGYSDQVIMAAGTFIQGSTIELSADGPIRPPFVAYIQGGLTYQHIKCMLENVLEYLN
jgi:cystathionine beta-lyase family protein involved in aluminum resistance